MATDEKGRFYDRIESRIQLNSDLRAGLREAILTNQTLKALVYIEMLFEELDGKESEQKTQTSKPKTTTTTKPKSTTTSTSTSTKSTPKKESEDKEDEDKKD